MSRKAINGKHFLAWALFIFLNFFALIAGVFVLLTNIPNPYPFFIILLFFGCEVYYFRTSIPKVLLSLIFLVLTVWLMIDTNGAIAVGLKCSPELRKPFETRDVAKIQLETANFDSCSLSSLDYFVYGLLKK